MFILRKIWRALFSWNTRFEIRPFALLPTKYGKMVVMMTLIAILDVAKNIIFSLCSKFHVIFIVDSETLIIFVFEKFDQKSRNWEISVLILRIFFCRLDAIFNLKILLKYQEYCGRNSFVFQLFRKNQQRGHGTIGLMNVYARKTSRKNWKTLLFNGSTILVFVTHLNTFPVDTGRKLKVHKNVQKTSWTSSERLMYV